MMNRFYRPWLGLGLAFCLSTSAYADDLSEITRRLDQLSKLVESQEARIKSLETENQQLRTVATSAPAATSVAPVAGKGSNLSLANPEIGIVADIVASMSQSDEDEEGNDKLSVRELELVIGHDIDPYSRFDATITASDFEDVSVEEAYVSHWGVPELGIRLGRIKPRIGVSAPLHRDQLDTSDMPLVVQNYFGVEGLSRTGLEVSGFIPTPWETVTHELIAGVMEGGIGEGGSLFGETRRRPSYYARLKNSADLSELTNLTLGGTYLLGSSDEDSAYEVNAFGIDATLTHHLSPVSKIKWQNEIYIQDRDEAALETEGHEHVVVREQEDHEEFRKSPYGFYSLIDYRLDPEWSIGARYDYVEPVNIEEGAASADKAYSAYLTFHQSEFARWRFQYERADLTDGLEDDRFFLQGTFAIGVHKHKIN